MGWGAATRLRLRQWRRGIHAGVGGWSWGAGCGGGGLRRGEPLSLASIGARRLRQRLGDRPCHSPPPAFAPPSARFLAILQHDASIGFGATRRHPRYRALASSGAAARRRSGRCAACCRHNVSTPPKRSPRASCGAAKRPAERRKSPGRLERGGQVGAGCKPPRAPACTRAGRERTGRSADPRVPGSKPGGFAPPTGAWCQAGGSGSAPLGSCATGANRPRCGAGRAAALPGLAGAHVGLAGLPRPAGKLRYGREQSRRGRRASVPGRHGRTGLAGPGPRAVEARRVGNGGGAVRMRAAQNRPAAAFRCFVAARNFQVANGQSQGMLCGCQRLCGLFRGRRAEDTEQPYIAAYYSILYYIIFVARVVGRDSMITDISYRRTDFAAAIVAPLQRSAHHLLWWRRLGYSDSESEVASQLGTVATVTP